MKSSVSKLSLKALLILVMLLSYAISSACAQEKPNYQFGNRDFVQYWSACQLYDNKLNPYDPFYMFRTQAQAGFLGDEPVMMWNPPWSLSLLCPLMPHNLGVAVHAWIALNILLLFFAGYLFWRAASSTKPPLFLLMAVCALFVPALDNIMSGQMGLLLTFALAAFLYFRTKGKNFLAGCCLSILSFKPHLFFLLGVCVLLDLVLSKNWKLLLGAICGFLLFFIPLFFSNPVSLLEWWQAFGSKHQGIKMTSILEWQPDALIGVIRAMLFSYGYDASWLMAAFPICASLLLLFYLSRKWHQFSWRKHIAAIIPLSLLFAPYGWFSDQAMLLITPITILAMAYEKAEAKDYDIRKFSLRFFIVFLLSQIILLFSQSSLGTFWFPALSFLLLIEQLQRQKQNSLAEQQDKA